MVPMNWRYQDKIRIDKEGGRIEWLGGVVEYILIPIEEIVNFIGIRKTYGERKI
jgi:hypothetical protein